MCRLRRKVASAAREPRRSSSLGDGSLERVAEDSGGDRGSETSSGEEDLAAITGGSARSSSSAAEGSDDLCALECASPSSPQPLLALESPAPEARGAAAGAVHGPEASADHSERRRERPNQRRKCGGVNYLFAKGSYVYYDARVSFRNITIATRLTRKLEESIHWHTVLIGLRQRVQELEESADGFESAVVQALQETEGLAAMGVCFQVVMDLRRDVGRMVPPWVSQRSGARLQPTVWGQPGRNLLGRSGGSAPRAFYRSHDVAFEEVGPGGRPEQKSKIFLCCISKSDFAMYFVHPSTYYHSS